MKKKVLLIATVVALAVSGTIYGFTFGTPKIDSSSVETKECPVYQNCPKQGQEDCPILANCPKKGTADCPYTNEKASCCASKK